MTPVIAAALSIVGGVLAGLVPALAVSQRRRLLRLVADESNTLEAVKDTEARAHLAAALRETSKRYSEVAVASPADRARDQTRSYGPPLAFTAIGFAVVGGSYNHIPGWTADPDVVLAGFFLPGAVIFIGLMLMLIRAAVLAAAAANAESTRLRRSARHTEHSP